MSSFANQARHSKAVQGKARRINDCVILVMGAQSMDKRELIECCIHGSEYHGVQLLGYQTVEVFNAIYGERVVKYVQIPNFLAPDRCFDGNDYGAVRNASVLKDMFGFQVQSSKQGQPIHDKLAGVMFAHISRPVIVVFEDIIRNIEMMLDITGREKNRNRLKLALSYTNEILRDGDDTQLKDCWLQRVGKEGWAADPVTFRRGDNHEVMKLLESVDFMGTVNFNLLDEFIGGEMKLSKTAAGRAVTSGFVDTIDHLSRDIRQMEEQKTHLRDNFANRSQRRAEKQRITVEINRLKESRRNLNEELKDWVTK